MRTSRIPSEPQSAEQRRFYHGVVVKNLAEHLDLEPKAIHALFKAKFLGPGESTTGLSKAAYSEYISQCMDWARDEFSVEYGLV